MKKNTILYYLKKHKIFLFVIALFLSLFGSYQVYHGQYSSIAKEILVILYSAFKLFTFSPTKSIMTESPIAYELAVWIAPAFTMVGFFSVFTRIYKSIYNSILHIRKSRYIVIGNNENTISFIKNLSISEPKSRITFFSDMTDTVLEDRFSEMNVKIVRLDFSNPENRTNIMQIRDLKISPDVRIISFEREPKNYGKMTSLNRMFELSGLNNRTEVFMETESLKIKELMEPSMDKLSMLNIHYFEIDDLIVRNLIENSDFRFRLPEGLEKNWENRKFENKHRISDAIGVFNVLIIGLSSISENFINQISNYLTVNADKNLKLTIIDEDVENKFKLFKESRTEFDKVIDLELIDMNYGSRSLRRKAAEINKKMPLSCVLFSDEDVTRNIFNIDKLADSLDDVPFAVYARQTLEIDSIITSLKIRHGQIFSFGDRSDVLTRSVIIDEELLKYAKKFNFMYNTTMNEMMGYEDSAKTIEEQWDMLTNVKKESSMSQTSHRKIKRILLGKFSESMGLKDIKELLSLWKEKLSGKDIKEQIEIIENDPYLNYITALEHKRWNNFYYMRDFVFSEEKNELKKTHDCLIDDWDEFLNGKQRDKAIYDTLSVFNILNEEEGEN